VEPSRFGFDSFGLVSVIAEKNRENISTEKKKKEKNEKKKDVAVVTRH
jgi:hypothetical protein